jgi:hypothetical protein
MDARETFDKFDAWQPVEGCSKLDDLNKFASSELPKETKKWTEAVQSLFPRDLALVILGYLCFRGVFNQPFWNTFQENMRNDDATIMKFLGRATFWFCRPPKPSLQNLQAFLCFLDANIEQCEVEGIRAVPADRLDALSLAPHLEFQSSMRHELEISRNGLFFRLWTAKGNERMVHVVRIQQTAETAETAAVSFMVETPGCKTESFDSIAEMVRFAEAKMDRLFFSGI